MQTLYFVITNTGDGANGIKYTFDSNLINRLEEKYDNSDLDYEYWGSGDGLQIKKLTLPDECTLLSLGISIYSVLTEEDIGE